jgi:hypothetical protein
MFGHAALATVIAGSPARCVIIPSAPQSVRESDQGFSLCCGLLMFVYEVVLDVMIFAAQTVSIAALKDMKRAVLGYFKVGWTPPCSDTFEEQTDHERRQLTDIGEILIMSY